MPSGFFMLEETLTKLIHRVVLATSLQCSVTGEVFFVIVTHIRSSHVLMLDTGNTLTNFLSLDPSNIPQHAGVAKVLFGQIIRR